MLFAGVWHIKEINFFDMSSLLYFFFFPAVSPWDQGSRPALFFLPLAAEIFFSKN